MGAYVLKQQTIIDKIYKNTYTCQGPWRISKLKVLWSWGNDHLIKFHLIEFVFFSVDRKFHNQLTKFFETFHLIKKFDQLPKKNLRILAVDRNFNNVILSYFKLSINCQKITCKFWQLIKTFKLIELVLMANF